MILFYSSILSALLGLSATATADAIVALPDLPYAYDALQPYISEQTLKTHHLKHHAKYVSNTNDMISGDDTLKDLDLTQIIENNQIRESNPTLYNNAAQSWNHAFYWQCMTKEGGGKPDPTSALSQLIDEDFGSFENFRKEMETAALTAFGSGWAWLCYDGRKGKLLVMKTIGAGNPLTEGVTPILTIDVWEHAYYLDYQEKRAAYVTDFFDKLVNWEFVQLQLKVAGENAMQRVQEEDDDDDDEDYDYEDDEEDDDDEEEEDEETINEERDEL